MKLHNFKRKLISIMMAICMLIGMTPMNAIAAEVKSFSDVSQNAWYAKAVEKVTEENIITGTSDSTFSPDVPMTRAIFTTALARLHSSEANGKETIFSDVSVDSVYAPYISWAVENNIVDGYADGTFKPDEFLTRSQAALMTANFLKFKGYTQGTDESAKNIYVDGETIPQWAQSSVAMVARLNVMKGVSDETFSPNQNLTRAQSAQIIVGLMTFLKEDGVINDRAKELCNSMTIDEKIGQVLLINFRNWKTADEAEVSGMTKLNSEVSDIIKKYHIGNIILFGENTKTTEDTARLTVALQTVAKENGDLPLLIGIDQEGGIVTRLGQGTCMPGNMALGAANNVSYAYEAGTIIGSELLAEGINCDFAPDADVNDNPSNPVIGLRSFGSDTTKVSKMAKAVFSGLSDSGVIGCAKHFPGHGNTSSDTHTGLAVVNKTKAQWKATEAVPFETLIASGIDMVMSAHIQYPSIDDTKVVSKSSGEQINLPATLSHIMLTDVLRGELGFDGVICTDAMDMKAITDNFGETDAVVMALNAGADLLCNPTNMTSMEEVSKLESIYSAIRNAISEGSLPQSRLDEAVTRVLKLKLERGILENTNISADEQMAKAKAVVGCDEHRAAERKIAEAAVTFYGDAEPMTLKAGDTVLFAVPYDNEASSVQFAVKRLIEEGAIPNINVQIVCYNKAEVISEELAAQIKSANHVVVLSEMYGSTLNNTSHWLNMITQEILKAVKVTDYVDAAIVSIGLPYDAVNYSEVPVYVAYGYVGMNADDAESGTITAKYGPNIAAGVGAALGAFKPTGKLPVSMN